MSSYAYLLAYRRGGQAYAGSGCICGSCCMKKRKKKLAHYLEKKKVAHYLQEQTCAFAGRICGYVCPHTTRYYYWICVLTLLYPAIQVGPVRAHICVVLYTTIYVSSYYGRARRRTRLLSSPLYTTKYTSSYYYMCVPILYTTSYFSVFSYYYILPQYMCPHTTIYYYTTGGAGKGAQAAGRVSVAAGGSKSQQRIEAASRSHALVA